MATSAAYVRGAFVSRARRGGLTVPSTSGAGRLDVDLDVPPFLLPEARHAERRPGDVADDDRHPDVGGLQAARGLKYRAETERHDDLRHDGNVEGAPRIACALQASGIAQRRRNEEAGHSQIQEQVPGEIEHF